MARRNLNIHRFFSKKKIVTFDSKKFTAMLLAAKDNQLATEFRPVCVREGKPLSDWTTDPDEADRIATEHRLQHKHATTVQIKN